MMKQWTWRTTLTPEEVFRKPWDWSLISAAEAAVQSRWAPVVVVTRAATGEHAMWYEQQVSLFRGAGPPAHRSLRYFQYVGGAPGVQAASVHATREAEPEPEPEEESEDTSRGISPAEDAEEERKTSWVKFKVVDDATGKPIPGIELEIDLPGGEGADQPTAANGMIEIDGIEKGSCTVRSSLEGARLTDTLAFVGMGETPIGASEDNDSEGEDEDTASESEGTKQSSSNGAAPAENSEAESEEKPGSNESSTATWRHIAVIEEYKVKTGDTLKSLAKSCGMTWAQLAEFNWGTSHPDEINEHLRDEVGCTKKTPDGDNYVLNDSDEPGIVYLPTPFQKDGLMTGRIHTLRVRPVAPGQTFIVDLYIAPDDPLSTDDVYAILSEDGSVHQKKTVRDDAVRGDDHLTLVYTGLVRGRRYTLEVDQGAEGKYFAFYQVPLEQLIALDKERSTSTRAEAQSTRDAENEAEGDVPRIDLALCTPTDPEYDPPSESESPTDRINELLI